MGIFLNVASYFSPASLRIVPKFWHFNCCVSRPETLGLSCLELSRLLGSGCVSFCRLGKFSVIISSNKLSAPFLLFLLLLLLGSPKCKYYYLCGYNNKIVIILLYYYFVNNKYYYFLVAVSLVPSLHFIKLFFFSVLFCVSSISLPYSSQIIYFTSSALLLNPSSIFFRSVISLWLF